MKRRRAAFTKRSRIQFSFNGGHVIDDAQARAAREKTENARMVRRRRMMQELRRETFDHAVSIVDAQLTFIDKKTVGRRFALEKCNGAFDSPNPPDERASEQSDDA